jgi:acyl-CoA thioester hydrolase
VHETVIHVRWGELDPYNHVNHAVYSSYLEHARVDALAATGADLDQLAATGVQIVVVHSDVRFLAPATAGDTLVVSTGVAGLRGASMTWQQSIARQKAAVVEARITAAVVGPRGRPIRMPDPLRDALIALG